MQIVYYFEALNCCNFNKIYDMETCFLAKCQYLNGLFPIKLTSQFQTHFARTGQKCSQLIQINWTRLREGINTCVGQQNTERQINAAYAYELVPRFKSAERRSHLANCRLRPTSQNRPYNETNISTSDFVVCSRQHKRFRVFFTSFCRWRRRTSGKRTAPNGNEQLHVDNGRQVPESYVHLCLLNGDSDHIWKIQECYGTRKWSNLMMGYSVPPQIGRFLRNFENSVVTQFRIDRFGRRPIATRMTRLLYQLVNRSPSLRVQCHSSVG